MRQPQVVPEREHGYVRALLRTAACHYIKRYAIEDMVRLAALLGIVGPKDDPDVTRTYYALTTLFFEQRRVRHWRAAIEAITPTREHILRIVCCCEEHNRIVGPSASVSCSLARAQFTLPTVVSVMNQVADPQTYIRHCVDAGMIYPGVVFHPNTLEYARRRLRGSLGALSDEEYREEVSRLTVREV